LPRFSHAVWDDGVDVRITTVDTLVEEHGEPDFIKIDVEGYDKYVIAGMTRKYGDSLLFEFVSERSEDAIKCVKKLSSIGYTKFKVDHKCGFSNFPMDIDDMIENLSKNMKVGAWGNITAS